uniref:F-box domain-containing protein n=1 Tax=Entomoneis paludosa TaxID=265537 RepID=A0A7S2VD89_9STRA|mmetsp:Transcript_17033/g.35209  ORF Transcript_17033/g.35209 Transcript_17033/m.35209 type:complete len:468 (+) Transcript_17033:168-1571(+)
MMTTTTASSTTHFSMILEQRDLWNHTLSYLELADLARAAAVGKHWHGVIFGKHKNNDAAWVGAEQGLTGQQEQRRLDTISSAQEHCRLFQKAVQFVNRCEQAKRGDDNSSMEQVGVDFPLQMMNIKGVVPEAVEQAHQAAANTDEEEWMEGIQFRSLSSEEMAEQEEEEEEEEEESEPPKEYNHEVFVRVSRLSAKGERELIEQGFVRHFQTTAWKAPIDRQCMHLLLSGGSASNLKLVLAPEYKRLVESSQAAEHHGGIAYENIHDFLQSIQFTAVVVHKDDEPRVRLLHCTKDLQSGTTRHSSSSSTHHRSFPTDQGHVWITEFPCSSKFRPEYYPLGLGPMDRYSLSCSFAMRAFVDRRQENQGRVYFDPMLSLSLQRDSSFMRRIMERQIMEQITQAGGRIVSMGGGGFGHPNDTDDENDDWEAGNDSEVEGDEEESMEEEHTGAGEEEEETMEEEDEGEEEE